MKQQPDKLFHDKLENFSRPVPSLVWDRVEARLDKKNDKAMWLKIAASVAIVALAAYLLWPTAQSTPNTLSGNKPVTTPKTENQAEVKPLAEKNSDTETEKQDKPSQNLAQKSVPSTKHKAVSSRKKKVVPEPKEAKADEIKTPELPAPGLERSIAIVEEQTKDSGVVTTEESVVAVAETNAGKSDRVTIIFSADEVNDKYLDKKSLAEATSDDKKPSTLRKLIDKAYDLKNNEDPFGDLRQKKNEILALNFKNDKQRSENK